MKKLADGFSVLPATTGAVGDGALLVSVGPGVTGLAELVVGLALELEVSEAFPPHADRVSAPTAVIPTASNTDFPGLRIERSSRVLSTNADSR